MAQTSDVAKKLKTLRERAGLSVREMAAELDLGGGSSYAHYETRYKKPFLPPDLVQKMRKVLEPRGVAAEEILALGGLLPAGSLSSRAESAAGGEPAGHAAHQMAVITELDVRAQAGAGAIVEAESPLGTWTVPRSVLRSQTSARAEELRIITVYGDSMAPTLMPGQRVMVDTSDRRPSPPGIFVVWDGLGLVVKRIEYIPNSEPATVRIVSDNEHYKAYERSLDEAHIQGRVIGAWMWF